MSKETQAVLGEARLSYVNLLEPVDRNNTGNPKYSVTLLIPKDSPSVARMRQAIDNAINEGVTTKFGGQKPANPNVPVHDGDGNRPGGEPFGPECAGCYVVTATCSEKYPPQIVAGHDKHPAMPQEVYSGAYGYASVNFAPYNFNGRKGVGCYLNNVLISRDGEPLGGKKATAEEDFKDIVIPETAGVGAIDPITGMPVSDPIPSF